MGLAVSQIRLLSLTERKADCEYNISIDAMKKMALTREQSELSKEYYAKLHSKNISYYANGQYNKMDYTYLMGSGSSTYYTLWNNPDSLKSDASMILTDANGLVVMGSKYVNEMKKVLGSDCIDVNGRGGTFSTDKIPELIAAVAGQSVSLEEIQKVINNGDLDYEYSAKLLKTKSQTDTGKTTTVDASEHKTALIQSLVSFFYPIFQACAANGWTTEYNKEMEQNDNYINDALVTGSFQLAEVNSDGSYDPETSLTYFVTSGLVLDRSDSSVREEITAWYNAEKEAISEKESWIDIEMQDLSTELEAINTEIQAVQTLIDDSMNVFDFGNA